MFYSAYGIASQILLVLIIVILAGAVAFALKQKATKRVAKIAIWGIAGWLILLGVLAVSGFFLDFQTMPPRFFLAVCPPVLLAAGLLFSRSFMGILNQIPPAWLIYVQSFRLLMEVMLWLGYKAGFVPPQMTFEWLNYDIVVGLTAPLAGYTFFGRGRFLRFEGIIWNIFGLALLLNIMMISVLSTPSPFRVFFNEPANAFISRLPFTWIPGFVVPFALAIHLFSLRQLLKK